MEIYIKKALPFIVICMLATNTKLQAQSIYRISSSKAISMKLSGTSSMHPWVMNASTCTGGAQFGFKAGSEQQLTSVSSLTFTLAVQDLKSGEKALDKNAYKALKTKQFKDITYKLSTATVTAGTANKYLVKTHGNLSIAGVTKEVAINVNCAINPDGSITCTGTEKLKMTDYQVKPPTFLAGVMKTGDDITLDFTLVYKK